MGVTRSAVRDVIVGGLMVLSLFLLAPWLWYGATKYIDAVYCATHDYVEHSWTVNTHHCTPVRSTM